MKSLSVRTADLKATRTFVVDRLLPAIDTKLASRQMILLSGPMAAGKTHVVRFLVEALGGSMTSSPTFAIHQTYSTEKGSVDHLDLFRIQSEADLESTGFWDLFRKSNGLLLIEWADRLTGDWFPKGWDVFELRIDTVSENERKITFVQIQKS